MNAHAKVAQIKAQALPALMKKPNVVGVGVGFKTRAGRATSDLCIVAMVTQKVPRAGLTIDALVPSEVGGVLTDVVQVGVLRAQIGRMDRWRPAQGGVSIGHYQVTAGTFGAVVRDRSSGARLILSNNHVLANSNDAETGDAIYQPGAADGGRETDTIARLERFCPLAFNSAPASCGLASGFAAFGNAVARLLGSKHRVAVYWSDPQALNEVDAAVARPLSDDLIADEILDIGVVRGVAQAELGLPVRKSGRTTGFTTGTISVLDASIDINYGDRTARFDHQIVTGAMSKPGDSGSLLVSGGSLRAVGLLFAGSDQATIYNPIQAVLDCLDISFEGA